MARVVVFEDGAQGYSIAAALATCGFAVSAVRTVEHARQVVDRTPPALLIVDVRHSDVAMQLVTELRGAGSTIPVLAVCADGESHVVAAFDAGADDCVGPPYGAAEVSARALALLRRAYGREDWQAAPIRIGRLVVCPRSHQATRDGVPVRLSPKEYGLLLALLASPRRAMERRELLARVWPEREVPNGRTLDMHIAWLRQKIEVDHRRPRIIRTVPSVGYLIASPGD
ncbi:MAG TPA: response regulator transcription factor [Gemmatimonadaceae bacterium]|nr:response regulator transcription factor [Gemmatimonadaceae bacterium]